MTETLNYRPVRDGYKFTPAYDVVETRLDGGLSRKRQDIQFGAHYVDLNWVLKPNEYTAFMGFFKTTLLDGTLPFLLDLVADIHLPTTHKCRCVGGLPMLTNQRGHAYYVSARLEVEQNPTFTGPFTLGWNLDPIPFIQAATLSGYAAYFQPGDTFRIFNAQGTHVDGVDLDLDGTYEVTSTTNTTIVRMSGAAAVNSDWTVLFAQPTSDNIAIDPVTITLVPT
jgi:hypothetical protein